jgi:hypothetical protein
MNKDRLRTHASTTMQGKMLQSSYLIMQTELT